MSFEIKDAKREQSRARIGLCGPSGSGKSYSALMLARGMVAELIDQKKLESFAGAIGGIDTERKSLSLYAHLVPFKVIEMEPPYSPERYVAAIDALERFGCKVIIVDQISHAWAGAGGLLEYVDVLRTQMRNNFSPWQKATPEQNRFVDKMLRSDAHIIATMRSKAEYVIEEQIIRGEKKSVPRKIGMAPVQRDGIEYEFTTMLDLDMSNTATASKDRSGLFTGQVIKIDEDCGRRLTHWLNSGAPLQPIPPANGTETGVDPLLETEAKLALLGEAVSERAAEIVGDSGADFNAAREAVKQKLLRGAGVVKGQKPTPAQLDAMLVAAPKAVIDG